ncbi:MAG TPA: hypothetical protein VIJ09_05840 [Acidimicrobiales bacterium]|jgi:hypothetical protein
MTRPYVRRHRRPERSELLAHLVTWCPGCGGEIALADCVSVSVVSNGSPARTQWRCPQCPVESSHGEPVRLRREKVPVS